MNAKIHKWFGMWMKQKSEYEVVCYIEIDRGLRKINEKRTPHYYHPKHQENNKRYYLHRTKMNRTEGLGADSPKCSNGKWQRWKKNDFDEKTKRNKKCEQKIKTLWRRIRNKWVVSKSKPNIPNVFLCGAWRVLLDLCPSFTVNFNYRRINRILK